MPGVESFRTVLNSVVQVFGLVAASWLYARWKRPDLAWTMRLAMHIFIPCLVFTAILDSRVASGDLAVAAGATGIQIVCGLLLSLALLRGIGWKDRRELALPISFVNSANLPFPLLLANFGQDGLSLGVACYVVTSVAVFSLGIVILHGGGRLRQAFTEPALWAALAALLLRLIRVKPPESVLQIPRLAALAAVPLVLVLFGDSLARTRMTALRPAVVAVAARYLSGGAAIALTLWWLKPEGLLRQVLMLYAFLPAAMVNVILTQKAGRDETAVASAVLLGTLASLVVIPAILLLVH